MHTRIAKFVGLAGIVAGMLVVFGGCPAPQDIVIIPDPGLDAAIRAAVGVHFGFLSRSDLLQLKTLDAKQRNISSLQGLQYATNLTWLDLDTNQITDITPLAGLTNLSVLDLNNNQVFDILPLAGLLNLNQLSLTGNQIADINPLVTNASNNGLGPGDTVVLDSGTLSDNAVNVEVPALEADGVNVILQ